jgi:argininosuccinate lyase
MRGATEPSSEKRDKLWSVFDEMNKAAESFTAGDDYLIDRQLIEYDCIASIAHVKMLSHIGVLKKAEAGKLIDELQTIRKQTAGGTFSITPEQEDSHTAIEQHLTHKLGDLGKKIHTGRSRNDQILTALRLYYKAQLNNVEAHIEELVNAIDTFDKKYGRIRFPGYTHTRKAMPSSFSMWAGMFRDSLSDDKRFLKSVYGIIDQSPLGTGAGYGVPLKLDRKYSAKLLGFSKIQKNPMYAQHSRGKFESMLLHLLSQILFDMNRIASDIIFFSLPELGYLRLPTEITTGSSIMPQKKNPDVLELIRAKYHMVAAMELQVRSTTANLISGYHRDIQETKGPVLRSFAATISCLNIMSIVFNKLSVQSESCAAAMTDELFAVEEVYVLVARGMPFRDAYRRVAKKYQSK